MDLRILMHSSGTASGMRLGLGWRKWRLQSRRSKSSLFCRTSSSPGYQPFVLTSGPSSSVGLLVEPPAPIVSKKSLCSQDSVVEGRMVEVCGLSRLTVLLEYAEPLPS